MREKYDAFLTTYLENKEVQNYFYLMPGSTEDTGVCVTLLYVTAYCPKSTVRYGVFFLFFFSFL
jgi:hypothetical protein